MKDRIPTKPGRVLITPENGVAPYYATMAMADEPVELGDAPVKANLLPDDVAAALGLAGNPQVKDALAKLKTDINGVELLYKKIRNIPETSGTTSLSISIADINWSEWRSIRLVCEVKCASAVNVRINASNDNNYTRALLQPGSNSLETESTSQICSIHSLNGSTPFWAHLDIELERATDWPVPFFRIHVAQNNMSLFKSGISRYNAPLPIWTTINLVAATSGHTVYIKNVSLWGVRR